MIELYSKIEVRRTYFDGEMEDHVDGDNRRVICVVVLVRDGKFAELQNHQSSTYVSGTSSVCDLSESLACQCRVAHTLRAGDSGCRVLWNRNIDVVAAILKQTIIKRKLNVFGEISSFVFSLYVSYKKILQ